jgi:hypothetical protein
MNYDLLLAYLTELGTGDWSKFRQAVEFVADIDEELYPSARARRLSILAHVEFSFYGDLRWSVCAPTLAWLPRNREELIAVLCGGRNQLLVGELDDQAGKLGLRVEVRKQTDGPDAIFVVASSRKAGDRLAALTGLDFEHAAANHIARCLPPLESYVPLLVETPEPSGYMIETFDIEALKWIEVPEATDGGLYRYHYYRPEYRLKSHDSCLRVTREIGIYQLLKLRGRKVLYYDPDKQDLIVPVRTPMPELFARTAALCSGLHPEFAEGDVPTRIYRRVPSSIARLILTKLSQC